MLVHFNEGRDGVDEWTDASEEAGMLRHVEASVVEAFDRCGLKDNTMTMRSIPSLIPETTVDLLCVVRKGEGRGRNAEARRGLRRRGI